MFQIILYLYLSEGGKHKMMYNSNTAYMNICFLFLITKKKKNLLENSNKQ